MITLPLTETEVDIVKRALVEFRDAERGRAKEHGPLSVVHEPALRTADRAHEIFERLLYANRVGCRRAA